MREFIYFSKDARTTGNFTNLMEAGRLDIACHTIIASLFLSHSIRHDVKIHLIFNGPPDAPKHIEIFYHPELPISKKDVAGLLKRALYKYRKGMKTEPFPGGTIEKKSLPALLEELEAAGKTTYILDRKGEDIRAISTDALQNAVFLIGDEEGIPKQEMRRIKHLGKLSFLGNNFSIKLR